MSNQVLVLEGWDRDGQEHAFDLIDIASLVLGDSLTSIKGLGEQDTARLEIDLMSARNAMTYTHTQSPFEKSVKGVAVRRRADLIVRELFKTWFDGRYTYVDDRAGYRLARVGVGRWDGDTRGRVSGVLLLSRWATSLAVRWGDLGSRVGKRERAGAGRRVRPGMVQLVQFTLSRLSMFRQRGVQELSPRWRCLLRTSPSCGSHGVTAAA